MLNFVWHLRGWANNRPVKDTEVAPEHNLGDGGAGVVTIYKRADGKVSTEVDSVTVGNKNNLGHNPRGRQHAHAVFALYIQLYIKGNVE